MIRTIAIFAFTLTACGIHAEEPPQCGPEALAAIEARYVASAIEACAGYDAATCPALPALRARADAERKEWIRCPK